MPVITMQHRIKEIINKEVQLPEYLEAGPEPSLVWCLRHYYISSGMSLTQANHCANQYLNKLLEGV